MCTTLTTAALVLALSCHAWAGIMPPPIAPPRPTPASVTQEPTDGVTLYGEVHTPGLSESLTQAVLELLAAPPCLF